MTVVLFLSPVPSQPPHSVIIHVLSSQSMEVTWSKPPSNAINGKLLGYRVYYYSIKNPEKVFNRTVTDPNERNATLRGLGKFTTYMIRVVAFTRKGEGVTSPAKGGTTLEDSKFNFALHYPVLYFPQYCKLLLYQLNSWNSDSHTTLRAKHAVLCLQAYTQQFYEDTHTAV